MLLDHFCIGSSLAMKSGSFTIIFSERENSYNPLKSSNALCLEGYKRVILYHEVLNCNESPFWERLLSPGSTTPGFVAKVSFTDQM